MKLILAVIISIFFFILGAFAIWALLLGISLLVTLAGQTGELPVTIMLLLAYVAVPAYGAFVAVIIASNLFKDLAPAIITTSFLSVSITLILITYVFLLSIEGLAIGSLIINVVQIGATVFGARAGKNFLLANLTAR